MTHSTQYETLDRKIIEHLTENMGPHPLYARHVRGEAERIAAATGRDVFRVIDGRLTALRKAGKIRPHRNTPCAWILTEQPS